MVKPVRPLPTKLSAVDLEMYLDQEVPVFLSRHQAEVGKLREDPDAYPAIGSLVKISSEGSKHVATRALFRIVEGDFLRNSNVSEGFRNDFHETLLPFISQLYINRPVLPEDALSETWQIYADKVEKVMNANGLSESELSEESLAVLMKTFTMFKRVDGRHPEDQTGEDGKQKQWDNYFVDAELFKKSLQTKSHGWTRIPERMQRVSDELKRIGQQENAEVMERFGECYSERVMPIMTKLFSKEAGR